MQSTLSKTDTFGTGASCPSYRESNRGSKERQEPTLGVRFTEVSVKRELTVYMLLSKFNKHVRNPGHRRVASKFRIGNHNLKIETGRFTIPRTPEDLRICDHCNLNSVENELHILFHCDLYNDLRKTLFIKINDRKTLVINYNIHDKVSFLFNNTDSHISQADS